MFFYLCSAHLEVFVVNLAHCFRIILQISGFFMERLVTSLFAIISLLWLVKYNIERQKIFKWTVHDLVHVRQSAWGNVSVMIPCTGTLFVYTQALVLFSPHTFCMYCQLVILIIFFAFCTCIANYYIIWSFYLYHSIIIPTGSYFRYGTPCSA